MYKKITKEIIERLEKIVGKENVIIDSERMVDYSHDEFSDAKMARMPELVVKPKTTDEVSLIMRLANEEMFPVTPRGGATGLCGGCVPTSGGIVLSLENMNKIIEVDLNNQMAVCEPGVTLMDFYSAVEEAGLFFPPHPGEESAMIGGVIATNAGGARAVKYGVIRNYVRGLEIVLPTGSLIHLGGKLMKSSTGYNLLNLIIGSEGTLGIITKATIQLMPSSEVVRYLIIPYSDLADAIETVPFLIRKKILPLAVEFVPMEVIQITEEFLKKKWPCSQGETHLLIILDASCSDEIDRFSEAVAEICMEKGALDVFVADSPEKQKQILDIRSKIYEVLKPNVVEVLDIAVPRGEIAKHVGKVNEVSQKYNIWLPTYGHAADGNVHTHIMKARLEDGRIAPVPEEEWREKSEKVREELYQDCKSRGGVISGEHGIGIVKKHYLSYVLEEEQLHLMSGIKHLFDPKNILNPNKIVD
ncbi:MAG: FAD-binding oxidoreductase [Candidatus Aminicenantes bacterium]|nr:MAG: FAD-binding oxidoreductase [Candidatus Aminicenantes bacterium]